MKKTIGLFALTILIMGTLLGIGHAVRSIPEVPVIRLCRTHVTLTLTATGKIEGINDCEVYAQLPLSARSVYVQDGDTVHKGDLLAAVDRQQTVQLLTGSYAESLSALVSAGVLQDNFLQAASVNSELIPQNIRAPMGGTIRQVNMSRGELSVADSPLFVISGGDEKKIRLNISETYISSVAIGQPALISGIGFSEKYSGVIETIGSMAQKDGTGSEAFVPVEVAVNEPGEGFKSGLTASVCIQTGELEQALVVPYDSVQIDEQCNEYVLICENGKVQKQVIRIDADTGTGYAVCDGLTEGNLVLIQADSAETGSWIRPIIQEQRTGATQ